MEKVLFSGNRVLSEIELFAEKQQFRKVLGRGTKVFGKGIGLGTTNTLPQKVY